MKTIEEKIINEFSRVLKQIDEELKKEAPRTPGRQKCVDKVHYTYNAYQLVLQMLAHPEDDDPSASFYPQDLLDIQCPQKELRDMYHTWCCNTAV